MLAIIITILSSLLVMTVSVMATLVVERQRTPIIGVLAIDADRDICQAFGPQVKTYIPASYVKWLESAGARVMPIWLDKDVSYYEDVMDKINGILIPSASVEFGNITSRNCIGRSNYFFHATKIIYEIAIRKNNNKNIFPIWGIDQGMHLLLMHSVESKFGIDPRWNCKLMDVPMTLDLQKDFRKSKMMSSVRQYLESDMRLVPFGYCISNQCIFVDVLKLLQLNRDWKVLATKNTETLLKIVTLLEHNKYPFYGSQFHPERVRYEQLEQLDGCYHGDGAVHAAQYFAEFFVGECGKSKNNFTSMQDETQKLIWNYEVTYTGRHPVRWTQCYLFEDADISYEPPDEGFAFSEGYSGCCY